MEIKNWSVIVGLLATGLLVACDPLLPAVGTDTYSSRSSDGEVAFTIGPRGVETGRFVVDVRVDTHSGDLAEIDLKEAMSLHAEGRVYAPVEAVLLSGHHAQGPVAFELSTAPREFAIAVSGVRDLPDLTFNWP